jgi:hypothetical protein
VTFSGVNLRFLVSSGRFSWGDFSEVEEAFKLLILLPFNMEDTTSTDSRSKGWKNVFSKRFLIFLGKVLIFYLFSVLVLFLVNFYLEFHNTAVNTLDYVAFHEIGNEANQTLLISKILEWENNNMTNLYENEGYPCFRIPNCIIGSQPSCILTNPLIDSSLLITTKCGRCGEFTVMFSELSKKFGIKSRIITADNINGGNHAWIEIMNGNKTTPVETMDISGFNETKFYNCKWLIQYRNIITDSGQDVSRDYYNRCS